MINSRSDAFKVFSGPMFKAIEDVLYSLPWFIKHVPVPERPAKVEALKKAGARYFCTDFTAFESHFTPEFMNICECELYRWCLDSSMDAEFLCQTLMGVNRMRTRTGCRASVRGRRMSGDMCTSLGNGFTNLMLAKFVAFKNGGELDGFVEGDDGIFVTDVELSTEMYAKLGFTIKIEEVSDPCRASFCGLVFSEAGEIVREPKKFMMKFGWTCSYINAGPKIMAQLLRAKALSTCYETPQCPIIGAFARRSVSQTSHVHPRYEDDGYHCVVLKDTQNIPDFSPDITTRNLFQELYGIDVETQILIENLVLDGKYHEIPALLPPGSDSMAYYSNYVVPT